MSYVAIAAGIVIILSAVLGFLSGLFKTVWSIAAIVISIFLAGLLYPAVQNVLIVTPVDEYIQESISKWLTSGDLFGGISAADPEEIIHNTNLPSGWQEELIKMTDGNSVAVSVNSIVKQISVYLTDKVIRGISFVLVFVIITLLMWFVPVLFKILDRLPVVHQLNHLAGGVVGLLRGVIMLWALALVVTLFSVQPWAQEILAQIHESIWLTWIYDNNLFFMFLR